ncbi:hypothetical protein RSK20926_12234 [Roseobacter sp. SK209-2-6]|uniref:hypothetical protein n=1 Tax=Roseobacter sp. SK209-2-6 TaxID=388739 RepID=UPI0000F3C55E|nr:hypothetical protein [Roseobacter sp. SK209-2-6]EBA18488.1 hypothetical protein RSK20926_12234 [Roseobacter sp. SK209-2-6]
MSGEDLNCLEDQEEAWECDAPEEEEQNEDTATCQLPAVLQNDHQPARMAQKIRSLGAVAPRAQALLARMFEAPEKETQASPASKAQRAEASYLKARGFLT